MNAKRHGTGCIDARCIDGKRRVEPGRDGGVTVFIQEVEVLRFECQGASGMPHAVVVDPAGLELGDALQRTPQVVAISACKGTTGCQAFWDTSLPCRLSQAADLDLQIYRQRVLA